MAQRRQARDDPARQAWRHMSRRSLLSTRCSARSSARFHQARRNFLLAAVAALARSALSPPNKSRRARYALVAWFHFLTDFFQLRWTGPGTHSAILSFVRCHQPFFFAWVSRGAGLFVESAHAGANPSVRHRTVRRAIRRIIRKLSIGSVVCTVLTETPCCSFPKDQQECRFNLEAFLTRARGYLRKTETK